MNQERKEELIVRWMDDELAAADVPELEELLEAEPELREMRDGFSSFRSGLKEVYAREEEMPYGDFFETRLKRAIQDSEVREKVGGLKGGVGEWFRWWLAPVGAGALALAFLAGAKLSPNRADGSFVALKAATTVYTPEGGVSANFVEVEEAGASVILLEGLQAIPDSTDLMASVRETSESGSGVHLVTARGRIY
ncbi:MAG: hypothetical protein AAGC74_10660 [Verrucomicrobiota bacterium]